MDLKIEIKEEPVWLEGTASTSFDNYKLTSDEMHLKEETKSELPEPGQTQDNYELTSDKMQLEKGTSSEFAEPGQTQPCANIKDEICIDEPAVGQLVACLKEEDNVENVVLLTRGAVDTCDSSCEILREGNEQMCSLSPYNVRNIRLLSYSEERRIPSPIQPTLCCNECGKKNSYRSGLRQHLLTHTGMRPHSCNTCGRSFSRKCLLQTHHVTHTAERPFKCNVCRKSFGLKGNLKRHELAHTEQRLHSCTYCCPGTRLDVRLARGNPVINMLDAACKEHGIAYRQTKPELRRVADENLLHKDIQRVTSPNSTVAEKIAALVVAVAMIG
ncbi:uncharacterized protein [Anabrus simplex]|uniref:uncharacterized protein n=1 Tax=Anabrus simplex TaxID=316456 RepID=UPI0035A2FA84